MLVSLAPGRVALPGRVEIGLAEHVVHLHARAGDDHARPAAGRGGEGGRVPACIDDADMGRGRNAGGLGRPRPQGCADGRGSRLDALLGQETAGGTPAIEIADEARASQPGRLPHGLGDAGDPLDAPQWSRGPEPVEDAERECDQEPSRRRRRVGDELGAAVGGADRAAPDHAVARQVGLGDRSSPLPNGRAQAARKLAAVEDVRSLGGQPLERLGQVAHDHPLSLAQSAVVPVDPSALGIAAENHVEHLVQEGLPGVEGDAGAGELDGRRDQLGPGEVRVAAVRGRQPRGHPRHGDGGRADVEDLGRALVEGDVDRQHLAPRALEDSPFPGTATKKSSRLSIPSRARWTSMKPPPPGPVSGLSATHETNAAAMHASTAFPPSARIRAPASAVSGWPAATAPFMARG